METRHVEFITAEVAAMVASGAVREQAEPPTVLSNISVITKGYSDKLRLVIDLRHVNRFVRAPTFKYESLNQLQDIVRQGDKMFIVDISSAYHHLLVPEEDQQYLGFCWEGKYYAFHALPFGLPSACRAFRKVICEMAGYWRSKGLRCLVYLDDAGFWVRRELWRQTVGVVPPTYRLFALALPSKTTPNRCASLGALSGAVPPATLDATASFWANSPLHSFPLLSPSLMW
mmetsp:Transcript_31402/g.78810  ORF Transcript_31402/g.78810 Transcript_31402/m.78810 type:complete len:230 (-) Transcript_31402:1406-2095(-)